MVSRASTDDWEPEGEENGQVFDSIGLGGLAQAWENDPSIRHAARKRGSLLNWGDAASVGIPSMILSEIWGW